MSAPRLAVLAIGGNALIRDRSHESIPDQYEMVLESNPELGTPMMIAIPSPRDLRDRENRIRDLLEF